MANYRPRHPRRGPSTRRNQTQTSQRRRAHSPGPIEDRGEQLRVVQRQDERYNQQIKMMEAEMMKAEMMEAEMRKAEMIELEMNALEALEAPNPYVLVLLDAHAMVFKNQYLRRGKEGGLDAAFDLEECLRVFLRDNFPMIPRKCEIVCTLFGDEFALGMNLGMHGIPDVSPRTLSSFLTGFTSAVSFEGPKAATYQFVNLEQARLKEETMGDFYAGIADWSCRQVFLGVQDAEYARLLEPVCNDEFRRNKVTLLSGSGLSEYLQDLLPRSKALDMVFI